MTREPRWILRETVLATHQLQIEQFGGSYGLGDENLLDSALARPRHLFASGKPAIVELAAAYAVGLCQNHAFIDGNKRTAFVVATTFLEINGYRFTAPQALAAAAMLMLAAGELKEPEFVRWLEEHIEPAFD
jgi:death-on-curing protein